MRNVAAILATPFSGCARLYTCDVELTRSNLCIAVSIAVSTVMEAGADIVRLTLEVGRRRG